MEFRTGSLESFDLLVKIIRNGRHVNLKQHWEIFLKSEGQGQATVSDQCEFIFVFRAMLWILLTEVPDTDGSIKRLIW
jgi:hypothetical protein